MIFASNPRGSNAFPLVLRWGAIFCVACAMAWAWAVRHVVHLATWEPDCHILPLEIGIPKSLRNGKWLAKITKPPSIEKNCWAFRLKKMKQFFMNAVSVLSEDKRWPTVQPPSPRHLFCQCVDALFFFSAPIKSRYLLSGFPESARSAPPTRNQRTLSTKIGWQFFGANVSFHFLLVGGFNPSEKY